MAYSFDGTSKIITLTSGTTVLDVRDLYSRWKNWVQEDGNKYLQAFSITGGDPVDEAQGIYVSSYFFLENNWKIRPQEASHKLNVRNGTLVTSDGTDPFVSTVGSFNVLIQYSQPVKAETVSTGGGTGASAEDVWTYGDRQLSAFTFPVSATATVNEDSIATKVWDHADRQLTSFTFLSSSNLTEDSIATAVWSKTNRELTAFTLFTPTQIASSVWVNPNRTLTDSVSISTSAISAGVWGDQLSSYGAGTAGQKLSSLASVSSGVIDTSSLLNTDLSSSNTPNTLGWILKKIYQLSKYIGYGK